MNLIIPSPDESTLQLNDTISRENQATVLGDCQLNTLTNNFMNSTSAKSGLTGAAKANAVLPKKNVPSSCKVNMDLASIKSPDPSVVSTENKQVEIKTRYQKTTLP